MNNIFTGVPEAEILWITQINPLLRYEKLEKTWACRGIFQKKIMKKVCFLFKRTNDGNNET